MSHFRRWGAIYILAALFLATWAAQFVTQLLDFQSEQMAHGQPFEWPEFWADFLRATFENWQSEWLQLLAQALLISAFSHVLFRKGDEDHNRLEAKVDRILARRDDRDP
jgi:hypothetical protein